MCGTDFFYEEVPFEFIDKVSWEVAILLVLSIGLAPYAPPHVWEKLNMLVAGELIRPIDWADLLFHGTPWALLLLKLTLGR